jgi:hypothetical protein
VPLVISLPWCETPTSRGLQGGDDLAAEKLD